MVAACALLRDSKQVETQYPPGNVLNHVSVLRERSSAPSQHAEPEATYRRGHSAQGDQQSSVITGAEEPATDTVAIVPHHRWGDPQKSRAR